MEPKITINNYCVLISTINDSVISAVKLLRNQNLGIRKISTQLRIGVGTVMKIIGN